MGLQTYMNKEWKILSHLFTHWDILGGNNCQRFFLPFCKVGEKNLDIVVSNNQSGEWKWIEETSSFSEGKVSVGFSISNVIFNTILSYILNTLNANSFWALHILLTLKNSRRILFNLYIVSFLFHFLPFLFPTQNILS